METWILVIHMTFWQKHPMLEHIELSSKKSCEKAKKELDKKVHTIKGGYYLSLCVKK